jgi:hypothetical protein
LRLRNYRRAKETKPRLRIVVHRINLALTFSSGQARQKS